VLNFGTPGLNTFQELNLLKKYTDRVQPDLIVIGFCYNDVRFSREEAHPSYKRFKRNFKWYKRILSQKMSFIGLNYLGGILIKLTDKIGHWIYGIPSSYDFLKKAYNPVGEEWATFRQSLHHIKKYSDDLKLPPPVFAVLDHFPGYYRKNDLDHPSEECRFLAQCFAQVAQEAAAAGFDVVTVESEVLTRLRQEQLKFSELPINVLDAHPSRYLNEIYAQKITDCVEKDLGSFLVKPNK